MSLIFYLNFIVQAQFFLQIFQGFFIVSTLDVTSNEEDMGGGKTDCHYEKHGWRLYDF